MADKYSYALQVKDRVTSSTPTRPAFDESLLTSDSTLMMEDLLDPRYNQVLRDYMTERKGVDYQDASAEEVRDDFVEHMRYFNANTVSTAGEVRFVGKGSDYQKEVARRAYGIYDQLGNVFVNDGFYGAVSGVADYMLAAAKDPTNYLGLLTGGVARAGAVGASVTGKHAIKAAVRAAGREALQSGATRKAAQETARKAGVEAARRAVRQGYSTRAAGKVYQTVAQQVEKEGVRAMGRQAMQRAQQELITKAGKQSLLATTALDSTFAILQDVQIQNVMLEVGAQEEYSKMQTAMSGVLGGVAGAAHLAVGKFRGVSGLADAGDPVARAADKVIAENTPKLNEKQTTKAYREIVARIKTWEEKVRDGKASDTKTLPAQLLKDIVLGDATEGKGGKIIYEGGILGAFKDANVKFSRNETISDVMTNFVRFLSDEQLTDINKSLAVRAGINLGDLKEAGVKLGDLLSKDISEAGKVLNVMSQFRKQVDASLVASIDKMDNEMQELKFKELIDEAYDNPQKYKYMQSLWKRLLVSSPATTMMNVAGFSQFYVGQTAADLFSATGYIVGSMLQAPFSRQAAAKSLRRARALAELQGQKIRNLMDPYTTHDVYMEFLTNNPEVEKAMFETVSAGVERSSRRFGINPESSWFKRAENTANAANILTAVRIQDSYTKSQMFMSEIDKHLRLKSGVTLREVINEGMLDAVDDDIISSAMDTTLKSVFAKNYTINQQGLGKELAQSMASFTETVSATPVLGTILPFGRFFNNVLATAWQWSPLGGLENLVRFGVKTAKREGTITEVEAISRSIVGYTGLRMAMEFDEGRREKGLAYNEIETDGGTIIDAKNTFPLSVFLIAGRVMNLKKAGEDVPTELMTELTNVLGVGQLAKDAQFGNDLANLLDIMLNDEEGARSTDKVRAFAKTMGNFTAGFTRPLDAVNKIAGFALDVDTAKDIRQAEGAGQTFTLAATRYVDNIMEAFIDKTDSITGEDLRVASREGDIYDPNPLARVFGITVKPGRTATEKAYSMAEMLPWQASERTNLPAYDKIFNTMLAPMLEHETQRLISSAPFKQADLVDKRRMLRERLTKVKSQVRDFMGQGYEGSDALRMRLIDKASRKSSKEVRRKAMKVMRQDYGIEAGVRDLSIQELDLYIDLIEALDAAHEQFE